MTRFSDLKLDPKVLKAVQEAGYDTPTPIQTGAIPPALEGRDVLGIAQTGTGKTAGFTLPMITRLARGRARARMPRSLILCPTRELAAQVAENFDTYAKYTRLTKALLIGGVSFVEQDKLIDRGVDVLIATPGRLLDHFERGKLLLTGVEVMVVDEADRMLDMGFIPDIERIFQLTPFTRQTLFFSATMAPEIERITNTFLHDPARIEVARQATASETIEQRLITMTPTRKDQTARQKRQLLRALIDAEGDKLTNAIIFSNRKTDVDILTKSLAAHGYDAAAIHGDLNQSHRTRTLDDFREGKLRFLVASDVAARGLDIPDVSHVFNYDLPSHAEDYVHRIGRTGRAGRDGVAISIAVPLDDKYLAAIESLLKRQLPRCPVPEGFVPTEGGSKRQDTGPSRGRGRSRTGRGRGQDDSPARAQDDRATPAPAASDARPDSSRDSGHSRDQNRDHGRGRDRGPRHAASPDTSSHGPARPEESRSQAQRGHGRGDAVRGMGAHVPEFLTRSFFDALAATERSDSARHEASTAGPARKTGPAADRVGKAGDTSPAEAADTTATSAAPAAAMPADSEAAPASKPARTTRRRSTSKPAEPVEATAPTVADAAADAVADAAADTDAGAIAKPKTTRRRSTSKAKAVTADAADATTDQAPRQTPDQTADMPGDAVATAAGAGATDDQATAEAPAGPTPRRRSPARPRSTAAAKKAVDTPATAGAEAAAAETGAEAAAPAATAAPAEAAAKPAARRSRTSSRKTTATTVEAPAGDKAADDKAADDKAVDDKGAGDKASAATKAAPVKAASSDTETDTGAEAAKPKKAAERKPASRSSTTRKPAAKAKPKQDDEAAAKPEAVTDPAAEAGSPQPARRTTRRRKAATEATTEAAKDDADSGAT